MAGLTWGRRLLGIGAAVAGLLALRASSLTPLQVTSVGESVLRLSWTARPERIEQCRRMTDEQLAQRPAHMQMRWECEGHFARYLLTVAVDGKVMATDTVQGGGLRNDRPMHLFREYPLTPGERQVAVTLHRIDAPSPAETEPDESVEGAGAADRETREAQERRGRRAEALPETVVIDSALRVPAGKVLLVTYQTTTQKLVVVTD